VVEVDSIWHVSEKRPRSGLCRRGSGSSGWWLVPIAGWSEGQLTARSGAESRSGPAYALVSCH
jgi:hypothetical protein